MKIRENINPNNIFIIVDACNSGKIIEDLHSSELKNTYLLSSSSKTQLSYEDDTLKSTRFTYYFCEAFIKIRGETFKDVEKYITEQFKNNPIESQKQTPIEFDGLGLKKTKIKKDIIEAKLPSDEEFYITVELKEVDQNHFKFSLWVEEEKSNYTSQDLVNDSPQSLEKIVTEVHQFLSEDDRFKVIPSLNKYLLFVLPIRLIKDGLNGFTIEDGIPLELKYPVLLRIMERYRENGTQYYTDWKTNWDLYELNKKKMIKSISNYILNDCFIQSREFKDKPLVVIGFKPKEECIKQLYKSAVPVALWTKGCRNFSDFEKSIKHSSLKLQQLHRQLHTLQAIQKGDSNNFFVRLTKRIKSLFNSYTPKNQTNVIMLYDNPNMRPPDEQAPLFMPPL